MKAANLVYSPRMNPHNELHGNLFHSTLDYSHRCSMIGSECKRSEHLSCWLDFSSWISISASAAAGAGQHARAAGARGAAQGQGQGAAATGAQAINQGTNRLRGLNVAGNNELAEAMRMFSRGIAKMAREVIGEPAE